MRNIVILFASALFSGAFFMQACQSEQELTYARYFSNGNLLYQQHCQNCHGNDGKGLAQLYPPLTDSLFIKRNKNKLACIIKYGLKDTITVQNMEFSGKMPAEATLTDIDIAAIVTYITNSFGNKQGLYDVANAGADLKACQHYEDK